MKLHVAIAIAALTITPLAIATADRPHRAPPPAAIAACKDKAAGAACTVTLHDRAIAGTCTTVPDTTTLACRPDQPPPPPQAALDACSGKSDGDACSFDHDGHARAGTCARGPDASRPLACRPQHESRLGGGSSRRTSSTPFTIAPIGLITPSPSRSRRDGSHRLSLPEARAVTARGA